MPSRSNKTASWMFGLVLIAGAGQPRGEADELEFAVLGAIEPQLARSGDLVPGPAAPPYGPEQAAGPPNTPQAGDSGSAWASREPDGAEEWLDCNYEQPVQVRAVRVYANCSPGALIRMTVFHPAGEEVVVWEGEDPTPRDSGHGVSVIPIRVPFPVQRVRLTLDSMAVPGWNEIDAVGLLDVGGRVHWAAKATASSTYATPRVQVAGQRWRAYSPRQATGEPDSPTAGDQGSAWASATPDGADEWLLCEFENPQSRGAIAVYENNAPGAISKVTVFTANGQEITIFEGPDPTPTNQPWGVSVFPVHVDVEFQRVKLYLDSRRVPGYNEIDAVGLRSAGQPTQWAHAATASSSYGTPQPEVRRPDVTHETIEQLRAELQTLRERLAELDQLKAAIEELKNQRP